MLLIKKEEELQYDEKGDAYLDRTGNLYGADNGDVGRVFVRKRQKSRFLMRQKRKSEKKVSRTLVRR